MTTKDIQTRIEETKKYLLEVAPNIDKEQKHLDEGPESHYWHYGYLMALKDIMKE